MEISKEAEFIITGIDWFEMGGELQTEIMECSEENRHSTVQTSWWESKLPQKIHWNQGDLRYFLALINCVDASIWTK